MKSTRLPQTRSPLAFLVMAALCLLFSWFILPVRDAGRPETRKVVSSVSRSAAEKTILKEAVPVESFGNVHEGEAFALAVLLFVFGLLSITAEPTAVEPSQGHANVFELFRILPNGP